LAIRVNTAALLLMTGGKREQMTLKAHLVSDVGKLLQKDSGTSTCKQGEGVERGVISSRHTRRQGRECERWKGRSLKLSNNLRRDGSV
jgi:hypothetical protein